MSNTPILKSHWERYKAHVSLDLVTAQKLLAPFSTEAITELQWLSEGCANTNYKIIFANQKAIVLRIYKWKITAILDWEFAFAGSFFLDAGQFLRYAHKLPSCYREGFVSGMQSEGYRLPKHWELQAKLMDLLCLLQLLHYNPLESRPNLNRDVVALIEHTVYACHS